MHMPTCSKSTLDLKLIDGVNLKHPLKRLVTSTQKLIYQIKLTFSTKTRARKIRARVVSTDFLTQPFFIIDNKRYSLTIFLYSIII